MSNTPSLPASGHGEVAAVLKQLAHTRTTLSNDDMSRPGTAQRDRHLERMAALDAASALIDALTAQIAAPTPSPVEARADGLPLKRWQRVVNRGAAMIEALADGQLTLAETGTAASVMRELREVEASILAALESTPAQPVREGQEGKVTCYNCEGTGFAYSQLDERTEECGHCDGSGFLASQPDPAAEIARLKSEIIAADADRVASRTALGLATRRAARAESELAVIREALDFVEAECLTVRCEEYPIADTGDADVGWEVVQYYMAKPNERVIARGNTPLAAIGNARAALANTADRGQEEKGNG